MFGEIIVKVIFVMFVFVVVFIVFEYFWVCNFGVFWWCKCEIVIDICYWFFVLVFVWIMWIGFLIVGVSVVFNIYDVDELIVFYDNGYGLFVELLLWV